jgi:competence ComEA-like helix-hairpin-helix protein
VSPVEGRLQIFAVSVVMLLVGAEVVSAVRERYRPPAVGAVASEPLADVRLDLNSADAAALEHLPGIGRKRAADIVAHRSARGPFHSVEDLREIPGIKDATLAMLAPYVRVEPPADDASAKDFPPKGAALPGSVPPAPPQSPPVAVPPARGGQALASPPRDPGDGAPIDGPVLRKPRRPRK